MDQCASNVQTQVTGNSPPQGLVFTAVSISSVAPELVKQNGRVTHPSMHQLRPTRSASGQRPAAALKLKTKLTVLCT
ncbi:hypothetical protein AAFF_G00359510 [Aldrovandia affinis]|uniref:Uncharacterized protein n=1 Tax=Aldrovandia affinis TaxID=143900 RepID=A0AAD7WNC4_9TELE|nr:hypothetical protein AAFF_G00359510 [Aldrovandia affinis]